MSTRIVIEDDGDEVVIFRVSEEVIGTADHDAYGWDGMARVIDLVENIAETFGIEVTNRQDIV